MLDEVFSCLTRIGKHMQWKRHTSAAYLEEKYLPDVGYIIST